jgi:hypothetical protein
MKKLLTLLLSAVCATAACAANGPAGYLFVTFTNGGGGMAEQIYFGLSKDGRNWQALNSGKPVLVSTLGEKGVRDPYILRSADGKKFYIIATDLSIGLHPGWKRAVEAGSKSLVIWESSDLVHWSEPWIVKVAPDDAGCTWAPEAIYDPESRRYLVYWASTTKRDNFAKQRIWGAWTTDFKTFSAPFIFIEKPTTIIDTDIVRAEDGKYYRFTKDEKFKAITMEVADKLSGPWKDVPNFSLAQLRGYEGPSCYFIEPPAPGKPARWCLILDQYSKGTGYQPFVTDNIAKGQFTPGEGFTFPFPFRHGSVLPLSDAEYQRVEAAFAKP